MDQRFSGFLLHLGGGRGCAEDDGCMQVMFLCSEVSFLHIRI